jgi:hypothetical protein
VRACDKFTLEIFAKKVIDGIPLACLELRFVNPIFRRIRPNFVANRR